MFLAVVAMVWPRVAQPHRWQFLHRSRAPFPNPSSHELVSSSRGNITPEDLKPFKLYQWVLSSDQNAQIKEWAKSCAKHHQHKMLTGPEPSECALVSSAASSSSAAAAAPAVKTAVGKRERAQQAKADKGAEDMLRFFGRKKRKQ